MLFGHSTMQPANKERADDKGTFVVIRVRGIQKSTKVA